MKAYIFTDSLFCWVGVAISDSEEVARDYMAKAGESVAGCEVEVRDIVPGFLCVGGGNG